MNSTDSEYVVKVTYAELYNEELKDLLAPSQAIGSIGNTNTNNNNSNSSNNTNNTHDGGGLKIIDDPHLGPLIQNITEVNFTNATNIKQLLDEGESRRHFGVTNMNAHSSRSHVMVRLSIEMRKVTMKSNHTSPLRQSWGDRDKPTCVSTLNLVDLAGSGTLLRLLSLYIIIFVIIYLLDNNIIIIYYYLILSLYYFYNYYSSYYV